jgi:imidazole glycerol-phosphate synthase subunit HisF
MLRIRVIPCLLLKGQGLVKTIKFRDPKYVGDPLNAVKIFNEKEVDELMLLDIFATVENRNPQMKLISEIASECFMPLCYGGGVKTLDQIKELFELGVEKVSLNTCAVENPSIIYEAAKLFGSQSIVVSIDVKKSLFGKYEIFTRGGKKSDKLDPVRFAVAMERAGAGEIFLNSIDRDGTMTGYDTELIKMVTESVKVPVIASGGAGKLEDFGLAVKDGGASAVAAGSFFVFQGKHRAVLISYPPISTLEQALS